jgi:NAD(P)-dependent dehydrogenase (short-subunit alcohol dehydrogenase family)
VRVLVVGASGTIGRAVGDALRQRHEVVAASRGRSLVRCDIADPESIRAMYRTVGRVDAVVGVAGEAAFGELAKLTDADFQLGLSSKLMGQVNLVRFGLEHVADGGSFTLTAGSLAREPMVGSSAISLTNSGVEGFGRAAALEMPRGIRINVVSPVWLTETLRAMGRDASHGVPVAVVAQAYVRSVEGKATGTIIDVRSGA